METLTKTDVKKQNSIKPVSETLSDQDSHTRGVRDLKQRDEEDGKYNEEEQPLANDRRDPEESRYNEAGQLPSEQANT